MKTLEELTHVLWAMRDSDKASEEEFRSEVERAFAEKDKEIERMRSEQKELNNAWFDTADAAGLSGGTIFPTGLAPAVRQLTLHLVAVREVLKFIQFQSESWSSTGDTPSLRQAMRHFDKMATKALAIPSPIP